jgi:predicted dehydrogenase
MPGLFRTGCMKEEISVSKKAKKVGLMGCGAVANYGHLPVIVETEGLILYAAFDPNEESLKRVKDKYGIANVFSSEEDFFACDLDAVTITSPAPCHRNNVLNAAKRRLPVLCEKPLCMNAGEAGEMIAAMKAAGVSLYTAFCYRFSPSALKIRELVLEKAIGDVRSLRLIYNWNLHGKYTMTPEGERVIQKRREGRMREGGPMVDCGTHQIDLAHFWLGSEVVNYSAHGAWVDEYQAPDHMWLHMDHANGAHTMVEMSYSYHHTSLNKRKEFVYELIGTDGVIRYDDDTREFFMENGTGKHQFPFHDVKSFERMYKEWCHALETGHSDLLTSAEDGMRVVDIARSATEDVIRNRGKA